MSKDNLIYKQFVTESFDKEGILSGIKFDVPKDFNFGYDVLDKLAVKCPDKTALVWLDKDKTRRDFGYGELSVLSNRAANYLVSIGITKGDRVMVVLKRHWQFWVVINALHKIGAVGIPATHLLKKRDYEYRFEAAGIRAIICSCDPVVVSEANAAMKTCKGVTIKATVCGKADGWHDFDTDFVKHSDKFERPKDITKDDHMLMYFTSGTTGYPKIVVHTFSYPLGHIVTAKHWQNVDPNGLHYTISDTGWAKSVWGKLYGQWLCEAAVLSYDFDKFDAVDSLKIISECKATSFCAPPTCYRFFIKEDLSKYDLSTLRYACIAGEALNPEVYEQFFAATGLKLMEGYGQTEMTLMLGNLTGMEPKPGSMGKLNPMYNIALIDRDGNEVAKGETGEVSLKPNGVPGLFAGYLVDGKVSIPTTHGYYRTGDMAMCDPDGYFWFLGRSDDMIKTSGYLVGPFEIESVLMELPFVVECAITGEPDPIRGQVVKATIVTTEIFHPKTEKEKTTLIKKIQDYVKANTAPYKYPRIVEFVRALPKTISGKIRRVEIRGKTETSNA